MLVEAAGGRVLIHPSPPENLKVTTPLDLRLAELLLAERSAQSGRSGSRTQARGEADLADAEGDAEADRAEGAGDAVPPAKAREEDRELADHRGARVSARLGRQAGDARGSRRHGAAVRRRS